MKEGTQFVATNITYMGSPVEPAMYNISTPNDYFLNQLSAITYATQAVLLGQAVLVSSTILHYSSFDDTRLLSKPSFLEMQDQGNIYPQFVWGDVLKGIEEMSHNVTAALLTLHLGKMNAECLFQGQQGFYQYSSFELWLPYGVSNFPLLSCYDLTFSPS